MNDHESATTQVACPGQRDSQRKAYRYRSVDGITTSLENFRTHIGR